MERHWIQIGLAIMLGIWAQNSNLDWFRIAGLSLATVMFIITSIIMVREEIRATAAYKAR